MQAQNNSHERRNRLAIITGVVMGAVAVLFIIVPNVLWLLNPHFHGTVMWEKPQMDDFSLPRADGGTFRLSDNKGKVVVVYFGYTTCADVCPATLVNLSQMKKQLGERAKDVTVAFITVDPAIDTAARMKMYLDAFDPDFIGLVGTPDQLQPVYDQFKVTVKRADQGEAAQSIGIGHTTSMFLIDRAGRLRVQLHEGETVKGISSDIQILLNEPS